MKKNEIYLLSFSGVTMGDIFYTHNQLLRERDGINSIGIKILKVKEDGELIFQRKNDKILENKYRFLIDLIINKCLENEKGIFCNLNMHVLKSILRDDAYIMIKTLQKKNLIGTTNHYVVGEKCRTYYLINRKFRSEDVQNKAVERYQEELKEVLSSYKKDKEEYQTPFFCSYNKCLKLIKITQINRVLALEEIKEKEKDKEMNFYTLGRIMNFKNNKSNILSIDSQDRIYHQLTNLNSYLIKYFNIKCEMDISNCHPLLFSYYLEEKYKTSLNTIGDILSILDKNDASPAYAVISPAFLNRLLKDNNITIKKDDAPKDVIQYLYLVRKGKLWDFFSSKFPAIDRKVLKKNIFSEVFYSKSDTLRGKEYGKLFKKYFPNVYAEILQQKEYAFPTHLACVLMKFESKIFRGILEKCYEEKIKVVTIHDALLVLDVPSNKKVTEERIREIMLEEFKKYDLFPTIKTTYFKENNQNNNEKIA